MSTIENATMARLMDKCEKGGLLSNAEAQVYILHIHGLTDSEEILRHWALSQKRPENLFKTHRDIEHLVVAAAKEHVHGDPK